jgi:predicted TIM-barrel fold metal-dependent hydrolase
MHDMPWIISVDDHLIEPPDLWEKRLPAKYREAGPRVRRAPFAYRGRVPIADSSTGVMQTRGRLHRFDMVESGPETDFWCYENLTVPIEATIAASGREPRQISDAIPVTYEQMRPGFYEPKARLDDMTVNHVERSLCFPSISRFSGQTFLEASDKDVALACVQAYNDFMVEEWCGGSGGRLIPLCIVPLWDAGLAAAELRRNAARGVRAVAFCEIPALLGLPSIHDAAHYWFPFFEACDETESVLCMHIGSSSRSTGTSPDAPTPVRAALTTINAQVSLADWLLSGVLPRFPHLKLAYSEGQVGWMPFLLERLDHLWERTSASTDMDPAITQPPSSYMDGRVYGCLFEDDFGLSVRNTIGMDQITFECDYPHSDSTWPNTMEYVERAMSGLTEAELYKILRGNAIKMLGLPPELP